MMLERYNSIYPEELIFRRQFLELLQHPRCFHRDFLPGHITGSAWIIDVEHRQVLLTHHAKLNKWLQPGGHADGDENILRVALREAEEETGLNAFSVIGGKNIFDIDIHTIPARKDFPEHLHYDIRIAVTVDAALPLQITEESHDLRWAPLSLLESLTDNASMFRMRDKLKAI
jgi:8-oxo-dGTP pyrophosphatase MutT (NUDIX family)